MSTFKDPKSILTVYLPTKLLGKIEELMDRNRLRNRTQAIRQLLDVGLFVESKMGLVETWTSEDIQNIKSQITSGQLVDWVASMEHKNFTTLMHVFEEEKKARRIQGKLD